ncbi:NAD-dependent epimerase/dehydratase family protein [Parabacteroides sp.]|uniref:NAD-dependent epimerase/dehydratase family protein n=1 Tax=Parabacteroides sp. TaxID=1869337 RepID=UPI00257F1B5D|nr:NAD-dependent epimerase/dehydratase family protein [Parabacteroides sp.]
MDRVRKDIQLIVAKGELFAPLAGKTVMVTGATGLIGSMIVKTICVANDIYNFNIKVLGSIRNREKAEKMLGELDIVLVEGYDHKCDYIIHTVSPTTSKFFIEYPVETIQSSVGSAMEVLEIARIYGARMVYLSSMEQYGVPYKNSQIMTEDKVGVIDHLNIRSSYPESKRLCECLCASYAAEYGVDVKIARLAQTIGAGAPLTDNRMAMQFAKAVVEGRDIVLRTTGTSVSNYVYLSDAITGILTILEKGKSGEAYNICNDKESRNVRGIAELVCKDVADGKIGVCIELKENMGYAPDVEMYLDSNKLRELGWCAEVDMVDGYRRIVEYIKYFED